MNVVAVVTSTVSHERSPNSQTKSISYHFMNFSNLVWYDADGGFVIKFIRNFIEFKAIKMMLGFTYNPSPDKSPRVISEVRWESGQWARHNKWKALFFAKKPKEILHFRRDIVNARCHIRNAHLNWDLVISAVEEQIKTIARQLEDRWYLHTKRRIYTTEEKETWSEIYQGNILKTLTGELSTINS